MSQPTPIVGKDCVIKKGTDVIGLARTVTLTVEADIIKTYVIGSDKPLIASGNKSYRVSIDRLYVDEAFAQDLDSGAKFTIEIAPKGTGANKPKITVNNVVFTRRSASAPQDDYVIESIEGEGESITWGTY